MVLCVASATGGLVITGSDGEDGDDDTLPSGTVKVWREGTCECTILKAHDSLIGAVAVLPGGAHFVTGSRDGIVKLWTIGGKFVRTFKAGYLVDPDAEGEEGEEGAEFGVECLAAFDEEHFVVGLKTTKTARRAPSWCTTSTIRRPSTPSRGTTAR